MEFIRSKIRESIEVKRKLLEDPTLPALMTMAVDRMVECYSTRGGCVFFCGNGGSAADAQHLAAELVGRFYLERRGLASQALNTNSSAITAIANDYDYDRIFSRQIEAFARPGDVLVGLSTSGNSRNVLAAMKLAREIGVFTVALTGASGGLLLDSVDCCIRVPSTDTPRIQECHILLGHIVCEMVEARMAGK